MRMVWQAKRFLSSMWKHQVIAACSTAILWRRSWSGFGVTPLALLFLLVATAPIVIPVRLVCAALVVALAVMTRRMLPLGMEVTREGVRSTTGR